ncbi:helix-turn-helix domain-containing protein (plasmid) [Nocardia sp. CA-129566]|uniref:helix-turn-helix domain-containing protein n=1 Tax=Nocardia sp. CA-129566 TaxID=3239976 RepID=UPI003D967959
MSSDRARASDDSERIQQISYSVAQAHTATGLSESTLRRLVREGQIAARYYGAKILIDAESLRRYYESLPSERQVDRDCAANRLSTFE